MSKHRDKRIKIRKTWNMNPVTRIKHSRKAYDRNESKREELREYERTKEEDSEEMGLL